MNVSLERKKKNVNVKRKNGGKVFMPPLSPF